MAERNANKSQALATDSDMSVDESSFDGRIKQLGISPPEMTESVSLAVSALLERIDDVTRELESARQEYNNLEQLVDVDSLVAVPNRRAFIRRLGWAVSMLKRYGHPCSVVFFDLNDFKAINDRYGHAAGDEVIRLVAGVLTQSMRSTDFMARLGGDEFVVLLYHARLDSARRRASVIAKRIAEHRYLWEGEKLDVSASFGTYEVKADDTAESAIHNADKAMYEHKKALQQ